MIGMPRAQSCDSQIDIGSQVDKFLYGCCRTSKIHEGAHFRTWRCPCHCRHWQPRSQRDATVGVDCVRSGRPATSYCWGCASTAEAGCGPLMERSFEQVMGAQAGLCSQS